MSSHAELYRPQLEALVEDATRIGYLQGYKHAQGRIAALQAELDRVRCMLGEARIGLSTLSAEIERLKPHCPTKTKETAMTDYEKALANARDALAIYRRYGAPLCGYATNAVDALEDLLAAIAAQTAPLADHEPIPCGPRGYEGSLYVAAHEGNPYWTETPGGYNLERCPRAVYDALLAHAKDHPCPAP